MKGDASNPDIDLIEINKSIEVAMGKNERLIQHINKLTKLKKEHEKLKDEFNRRFVKITVFGISKDKIYQLQVNNLSHAWQIVKKYKMIHYCFIKGVIEQSNYGENAIFERK